MHCKRIADLVGQGIGYIIVQGAIMDDSIEKRIAELEEKIGYLMNARQRDDHLTKSAAGQLRKARNAKTLEEIITILLEVAGQLEASGG